MASGEPSPSFMKQMQLTICQLCGGNMGSYGKQNVWRKIHSFTRSHSQEHEINYQKQVDPPAAPYTQIFPDSRYEQLEEAERKRKGVKPTAEKVAPVEVCIPISVANEQKNTQSSSTPSSKKNEEPAAKVQNSTAEAGSSSALKASCLPTGGGPPCPPPVKMMLCLPCPPPQNFASSSGSGGSTPCPRSKPTDYTYRCESRELRGGNLYQCCQCIKRNGLQHDCPRTPCQGRPACLTKPWPDCWPSGGCHGIDYTREKGVKRIDPCRDQRFDKKECRPPGGGAPKADCGGNMMVVVCPPPSQN